MKKIKTIIVTGSTGLIGSEAAKFFLKKGYEVIGIDNNLRKYFFGKDGDTEWKKIELKKYKNYNHYNIDIRNYLKLEKIFKKKKKSLKGIIHCAAQPSHDWATKEPITDFTVNANGTLNLLELNRTYSPAAVFIFTSTNKVYGDRPNQDIELKEDKFRYTPVNKTYRKNGINEKMSIDNSVHSIFGSSKVAADIMVQEYGKYFKMSTGVFRGGCLTGPSHSGAELHGFLSYLVKCLVYKKTYTIYGYKGKQVRDNIHSNDLINIFWHYFKKPKQGEVYNVGGGPKINCSILEAINLLQKITNKKMKIKYSNKNRIGDHIWWVSDTSKFEKDFPSWKLKYDLKKILIEIVNHYKNRSK